MNSIRVTQTALDPDTQAHFTFHRSLLGPLGIRLELLAVWSDGAVDLCVQQVGCHPVRYTDEELYARPRAIFRFLPY